MLAPGRAEVFFDARPRPAFEPSAGGFCVANAWWLAELSRLIYREEGDEDPSRAGLRKRDEFLADAGLREEHFFDHGHTQCALVAPRQPESQDFVVLVFRGTSQLRDWITNLRAVTVDWPRGGSVHRGFRRALYRVWRQLASQLGEDTRPLFCAGHSLGGALGTLAASLLQPRAVYTFGSPRVGNAAFCASLAHTRVFRMVYRRDVVTALPPKGPVLGFRHAGELHYLDGHGHLLVEPDAASLAELRQAAAGLQGPGERGRRWFDPLPMLADHAPVHYVHELRRLL